MASVYDLKPRFQSLLRPLVGRLAALGVTANQVTIAAAVLSLLYGALILNSGGATMVLLGLPVVLLVRMALNAVDGMLAREHGQESRVGFFLNEIGDVVSDIALYLPLALVILPTQTPGESIFAYTAVVLFALTEIAGVLGLAAGGQRRYDGPLGKSDRAVLFSAVALVWALFDPPALATFAVLAGASILAAVTIGNRMRHVVMEARHD